MKNYKKDDANTKVRILKPILDDWNDTINDCWKAYPSEHNKTICTIKRMVVRDDKSLHGCLITDIAGICNAYDWTFGIYFSNEEGIHIQL